MIYLNKILPLFVLPMGVSFGLLAIGLWRRRLVFAWVGAAVLWVSSMPLVADRLTLLVQRGMERAPAAAAPSAGAIVVLSSGRVTAPGAARISEWADADRFFGGIELYRAGKAPLLIFTGGWVPWAPDDPPEGEVLARIAGDLGVPADRIFVTERVVNTQAEARAVAALLQSRGQLKMPLLLVTSAFHMARARALFEEAGLIVTPFPVDFWMESSGVGVLDLLPSPGGLGRTSTIIRELYGRWYYRLTALW